MCVAYTVHSRLSEPRLRHCKTCLRMRNLPTFVGVADFHSLRSSRDCGPIAPVSFIKDMTRQNAKKGFKYKVSIVKQLKNSSVAITAERYGL